ncbi:OLC1v1016044C1 [Oldenlandia corymbosa var. corymbosa]|uniref:OLC1v1016044C1 n=1 Tax=Oldenlandia corymbosa var. corymbosa TaxID=529605 RepID=A0AAV1E5K8_OLDCO|nr:OLC1v1016044C1 [Oldenlandia corymbosa var. corymbosa]
MAREDQSLHVIMFPWLAFGHLIPFLELSKFIAQKGHKVTFISTPKNIARLPKILSTLSSSIIFLSLSLPRIEGLPENIEATVDLGTHDASLLKKAYDGLETELTLFLQNSLPDWILYDFAPFWLPPIATKLGISKSFFSIYPASSLAFSGPSNMVIHGTDPRTKAEDFTVPPPWIPFDSKLAFKVHESKWIFNAGHVDRSGVSDAHRYAHCTMGADVIFVRQCNEFEGRWIKLLEDLQKKPVIPAGIMPLRLEENILCNIDIKEWLDNQRNGSVLYVAFGSELRITQNQLTELALGLELSGVPFFWVLRKSTESMELLPDGFEERVKERGIIWRSWAPQLRILSHESVGGFLTHCGWSSVIEGLMFGHPLIMLPFVIDTGLIARVLGEKLVGMEVRRNERDGSFNRNSVAETVELVMVKNEGKIYRKKSKEVGKIFGDRELQDSYLHKLVDYMEKITTSKKK